MNQPFIHARVDLSTLPNGNKAIQLTFDPRQKGLNAIVQFVGRTLEQLALTNNEKFAAELISKQINDLIINALSE
jgi:hypothetical protein